MIFREDFAEGLEAEDPARRLASILRHLFDSLEEDFAFWELFFSLRSQPAVMSVLGDQFHHWTEQSQRLLAEVLSDAGWSDPQIEAIIVNSLVEGTIMQYLMDPKSFPLQAVASKIIWHYMPPPD